ncbi:MAG: hypothetical protein E7319_09600 [Clostridiales bacterium]|nr:hypothetical protein [Clostridiales bacterium]
MKEINGTITLAYVEEDNKQRVIFRIFPLCTREGEQMHGDKALFPDDGSLRIVPDKREQSTFKERMREIGGLCAINLVSDGRELVKVRQNRNYAPDQGERNQLAIYSDVICEFAQGACFEVVDAGTDAAGALTPMVLIQSNKLLYGPVDRQEAAASSVDSLKPFGDDSFLLHQVDAPLLGTRRICWNPESLLNWRQRRSALRRRERGHVDEVKADESKAVETPAAAPEQPQPVKAEDKAAEKPVQPKKENRPRQEQKETKPECKPQPKAEPKAEAKTESKAEVKKPLQHPSAEAQQPKELTAKPEKASEAEENALPIGTRLDILDQDLSFDQQLYRLAQPLSSSANRLSDLQERQEEEPVEEVAAHFSGTPLNRNTKQITRSMRQPQSVHHVVERHLVKSGVLQGEHATYQLVDNPIENLLMHMEYVWQDSELRQQAIAQLMDNDTFTSDLMQAMRNKGLSVKAYRAAQEQLADIEAERLDLLLQLDLAKNNEKKFREEALANLSQKHRAESERLKREVQQMDKTRDELAATLQTMSQEAADKTRAFLSDHMTSLSGISADRIVLSPVLGKQYHARELSELLRVHMNEKGYGISDDDAISLLTLLSVSNAICLRASTQEDAIHFAAVLLESLGLENVYAVLKGNVRVEMLSLLPDDQLRTPTVTVQPAGTEALSVYGHKTIFVTTDPARSVQPFCPVFTVPQMQKRSFDNGSSWQSVKPASLDTFNAIRTDVHPLLTEAERWFDDLKKYLANAQIAVPDITLSDMRQFMEASMRKIRGGFVASADLAVCHWIVPALMQCQPDQETIREALSGLPRALEMLKFE